MWVIRVLNGPQAGQYFPLKLGKNTIGRGSTCDIKIANGGISKEHAQILVTEDKLIVSDLNSRNGTLINGVRIQHQKFGMGDKLTLHDLILDVVNVPNTVALPYQQTGYAPSHQYSGNVAYQTQPQSAASVDPLQGHHLHSQAQGVHQPAPSAVPVRSLMDLWAQFVVYFDNVAMPGVYQIAQKLEFRYALAAFIGIYILLVTTLATIPMVSLIKSSIVEESQRRAMTIARNMAMVNRSYLIDKLEVNVDVQFAEREEGVKAALIVNGSDGTLIAPLNKKNSSFSEVPFVNRARKQDKETVEQIDSSTIGASVPVKFYNAESGKASILAYSIVLYDMGSVALNRGQSFVMFVQTLAIALGLGLILFMLMSRVIEHPITSVNAQLDEALRDTTDGIKSVYRFPQMETLVSNINSALARIAQGGNGSPSITSINRDSEAQNLTQLAGFPCLAISAIDDTIIATNEKFNQLVGGNVNLTRRPIMDIPDVALQENIRDLIPQLRSQPDVLAQGQIPFSGEPYLISGQAILGATEPVYYIFFLEKAEES